MGMAQSADPAGGRLPVPQPAFGVLPISNDRLPPFISASQYIKFSLYGFPLTSSDCTYTLSALLFAASMTSVLPFPNVTVALSNSGLANWIEGLKSVNPFTSNKPSEDMTYHAPSWP